jgi:hypothetical protein
VCSRIVVVGHIRKKQVTQMPLGLLMVNAIYENVSYCDFTIVDLNGSPTDAIYNFMAAPITN